MTIPRPHLDRPRRLLSAGLMLLLIPVLLPVGQGEARAAPADVQGTGVGITPARFELDLSGRVYDVELTVFNDTERSREITMEVVDLGHQLDGTPVFGDSLEEVSLVEGQEVFTLGPGESQDLAFRSEFPDSVALYGAVLAKLTPDQDTSALGMQAQVAALLLLRGPRPWDQSVEANDVGVIADGQGGRQLYVDVLNIGDAHVRPTGTFVVRQDGEEIATVPLPGENVIPDYARRLTAPWSLEDGSIDGDVEIEIELDDGSRVTRQVDLETVEEGSGDGGTDDGGPTGATLEGGAGAGETIDGQRRVLLPLAAILMLLAIASLWWMVMWKRREEEEDDEDEPVAAGAASAGGEDEGS